MRIKAIILPLFTVATGVLFGQTVLVNEGTTIHVDPTGILYVEGDVINETTGIYSNQGTIYLSGDWVNDASNFALDQTKDGTVWMFGGAQTIRGTSKTKFSTLVLDGGAVKKDMLIDSEVTDVMDIMDSELQTNDNVMLVSNPNQNAIVWNNGYVASEMLGGYLARDMNVADTYDFPVGSSFLSNTYRAVKIKPENADSNQFSVRLAPIDPTFDVAGVSYSGATGGFDREIKSDLVKDLNEVFYHNIARTQGTAKADVSVNYFQSDGEFQTMAQWSGASNQWENTKFFNEPVNGDPNLGTPDMKSDLELLDDFNHDLFVLGNVNGVLIPEFISPEGDGVNDTWIIENIEFYPENNVKIFNRYGSLVYEKDAYDNSWNGSKESNGVVLSKGDGILPSGTYFYVLDLKVGDLEPYTGFVHIRKELD